MGQTMAGFKAKLSALETRNMSLEEQLKAEIKRRQLAEKCHQEAELARAQSELARQAERAHYVAEYDKILAAYKAAQRARFGKKSERFIDDGNIQQSLFDQTKEDDAGKQPSGLCFTPKLGPKFPKKEI